MSTSGAPEDVVVVANDSKINRIAYHLKAHAVVEIHPSFPDPLGAPDVFHLE